MGTALGLGLAVLSALAALALPGGAALFPVGLRPIEDGATPPAQRSVQACGKCHPLQTREWQQSRHAKAWVNGIFQREYKQQPLDWCIHCHAPLRSQIEQIKAGGGELADEGVTCAVCHQRDGKMLAREKHPDSPHDTVARADFGSAQFCGGCHQFNFPLFGEDGQVSGYSAFPMQNTVAQFLAGPYAGATAGSAPRCGQCHAQSPGGHTFPGAHDEAMLDRALGHTLCRTRSEIRLVLTNRGAGHNVPTGDVHRHILARLWRSSEPERMQEFFIGRRYEPVAGGGKKTVLDTTLAPGQSRSFALPLSALGTPQKPADREPLSFELRYVYTIDEFPFPGHEVAEPTWHTIASARVPLDRIPVCAGK